MDHLMETDPEFRTTMDKLNELKKKRERYKKEKEELHIRLLKKAKKLYLTI